MTTAPKLEPTDLVDELKALSRAYVSLLELGRNRILDLGGTCDPVDVMEKGDPALVRARAAVANAESRAAPSAGLREALTELASVKPALKAEQRKHAKARRRIHQLERAIAWALGESPPGIPEFMWPEGDRRPYWWRTQLRALTLSKERGGVASHHQTIARDE
ncbi:hypothetical protein [Reyranella sp.]|uniref:hypothetical protein n=1 Tax=Reyranella sp. TaxID=1929291 RepID=UPI0011F57F5C|nr:hypothetical protein [Reyranella sp.]TAJ89685.1 MAG: hypothetical protein EPO50_04800 [Reyranella sp.]